VVSPAQAQGPDTEALGEEASDDERRGKQDDDRAKRRVASRGTEVRTEDARAG
jgi:hypothetical protein